ncbi:MAG: aldehyde dehydrogenase family protein [Firmicutes bacterium]|nr:aldehyde dehydrogenase family protein [Bacillota bacterium]
MELRQYIGGAWIPGSGALVNDVNPSHPSEAVAHFYSATPEDVQAAVASAAEAFPEWANTPAPARGRILARFHQQLLDHQEEYVRLMMVEQGKTRPEAEGEFQKGVNLVEFFAGEGFRLNGETIPSEVARTMTYTLRVPLGVVAVITPWNFPFAIPLWKISPALVAGNTVVFKPATYTPWIGVRIVEDLLEAGLPPRAISLILGAGGEAGEALVSDRRIRALSFTGSNAVGARLQQLLVGRSVKVTMEMGGKNAVVVAPSADLDLAAQGVVQGAFGAAGQRCTATSRVLVHEAILAEFTQRLSVRTRALAVGPSERDGITVGPLISEEQLKRCLEYVQDAVHRGAAVIVGGDRGPEPGFFMQPTILDRVTDSMPVASEEIFGPVLALMPYRTLDEAIRRTNHVPYGLSASIYTRDLAESHQFIHGVDVGMVHVNNPTIGGEAQLPFGGVKASGLGPREMGHEGTLFFTEVKTVFMDYSGTPRIGNFY